MKKNMKIEINKDQPPDEVVSELERLGCIPCMQAHWEGNWVAVTNDKYAVFAVDMWADWRLTTLAELKEMK